MYYGHYNGFFHTIIGSYNLHEIIPGYRNFLLGPCYIFIVPYTGKEQILIKTFFFQQFSSSLTYSLGCIVTRSKTQYKGIFLNTTFTHALGLLSFRNITQCIRILLKGIFSRLLGIVFVKKIFQPVRIF